MGDVVTTTEAEDLLRATLEQFERGVEGLVRRELNPNQFSALVSLAFNIGLGAMGSSTLLRKVNANRWDPTIRAEFGRWVHGGGKVLPGLVSRRKAEADLYFEET